MATTASEIIGVKEVAELLGYTERQALEHIKRIGVPIVAGTGIKNLRFRRVAYLECETRAERPLPPRAERLPKSRTEPAAAPSVPAKAKSDGAARLRALRAGLRE